MDLSIVRPANAYHRQSLFSLECAGKELAGLVRQAQPEGPYLLAGYCYGGVVAFEAASQLVNEAQDVRLILFDVPMPGSPPLLRGWRIWLERARCEWRMLRNGSHPRIALNLSRFAARLAWTAAVPVRRLLVSIESFPGFTRFLRWTQIDDFPIYRARLLDAPILHFLCADEPHIIQSASRFGWRAVAHRGIDERFVAHDHSNTFHESNLPEIVTTLQQWIGRS
jgi:surfactin synthase thioesterase subunit